MCCSGEDARLAQFKIASENPENVRDEVKDYYGKLNSSADLKTSCCTSGGPVPKFIRDALSLVNDEVSSRYYGCGICIPDSLEGMTVLDLGSGSGRDCYALAKLVGESGSVIGVDMTEEQVAIANKYKDYHREKFGYEKGNVEFKLGYIEKLQEAGIEDNSIDIIVSNCVINLSPDKKAVLSEAYRVLKPGGELYFSDVYVDKSMPQELKDNKILWGECLSGALQWQELVEFSQQLGFLKPRLVTGNPIKMDNSAVQGLLEGFKFASVTYRLFKLPAVEEDCCQAIYNGSLTGSPDAFKLDARNVFQNGEIVSVSQEVAAILKHSRFQEDFTFQPCTKKPKSDDGGSCCTQTTKEALTDPFQYFSEKTNGAKSGGAAGCNTGTCQSSQCCT